MAGDRGFGRSTSWAGPDRTGSGSPRPTPLGAVWTAAYCASRPWHDLRWVGYAFARLDAFRKYLTSLTASSRGWLRAQDASYS